MGALVLLALLAGCDEGDVGEGRLLVEGDPENGRRLIARLGCGACHVIPGVKGARGRVGPSLDGFSRQGYIAGEFPNRAPMLIRWITEAPALSPRTAMPASALTEREARDVASYLYRLE
ncbi:MAG: c-type cytochrome [Acetobacteraceae bacterium]|nr:c-type cytochrome [Acetobacteraceae bacterium]